MNAFSPIRPIILMHWTVRTSCLGWYIRCFQIQKKKKKNSRKCFPKRRQQAISFKSCQNKFGRFGFSPTLYLITLIRRLEQNNFALLEATVPVTEKCKHAKQKQTVAKSGREGKRNTRLNFFFLSSSRHPHPDEWGNRRTGSSTWIQIDPYTTDGKGKSFDCSRRYPYCELKVVTDVLSYDNLLFKLNPR